MIKKIYLILFISIMIVSCGKKGDPIYKAQTSKISHTKLTVVS